MTDFAERAPTPDELKQCFDLEQSMTPDVPEWEEQGFFLPGVTFATYEDLAQTGYARIVGADARVESYILAAPPGHAVLQRLLASSDKMIWFDPDHGLAPDNAYWIAKIATALDARRKGQAAALYDACFEAFPGATGLTATAVSPKRNQVSEGFHRALGFRPCGLFLSGHRPGLGDVVNIVWQRPPASQ